MFELFLKKACIGLLRASIVALMVCNLPIHGDDAIKRAATLSGAPEVNSTREKLSKVLKLINIDNYIHQNETPESHNEGPKNISFPPGFNVPVDPATGKPRDTHPYEWDSLRTPEEILARQDGGSCGSHALALAAMLKASGVDTQDIRLLGTVLAQDYQEICPGAAGDPRKEKWEYTNPETQEKFTRTVHPANGHVFLQVKINGGWYLLNSTCNPLNLQEEPETPAKKFLRPKIEKCFSMPKGPAKRKCFQDARNEAALKVRLEDYEMIPYALIEPESLVTGSKPRLLPIQEFPSLKYLNPDRSQASGPPLLAFNVWTMENYPRHTIEQRNNMVASGDVNAKNCRWSGDGVGGAVEAASGRSSISRRGIGPGDFKSSSIDGH